MVWQAIVACNVLTVSVCFRAVTEGLTTPSNGRRWRPAALLYEPHFANSFPLREPSVLVLESRESASRMWILPS